MRSLPKGRKIFSISGYDVFFKLVFAQAKEPGRMTDYLGSVSPWEEELRLQQIQPYALSKLAVLEGILLTLAPNRLVLESAFDLMPFF